MNKLKQTKVSTAAGALLLVASIVPILIYTLVFRIERDKLQNGPETSPKFVVSTKQ